MLTTVKKINTVIFSWKFYECFRSSHRRCFMKKAVFKNLRYSQESCRPATLLKGDSNTAAFL